MSLLGDLRSPQAWWLGWAVLYQVFVFLFFCVFYVAMIPVMLWVVLILLVPIPRGVLVLRILVGVIGLASLVFIIPLTGRTVRNAVLWDEDWEMVAKRLHASWYGGAGQD